MLSVYVDDLILSGPQERLEKGWSLIRESGILLDRVEEPGLYLGCSRHFKKIKVPVEVDGKTVHKNVSYVEYDMEHYLKDTVERYKELYKALTKQECVLKTVKTFFFHEDTTGCPARAPGYSCPWCNRSFEAKMRTPKVEARTKVHSLPLVAVPLRIQEILMAKRILMKKPSLLRKKLQKGNRKTPKVLLRSLS